MLAGFLDTKLAVIYTAQATATKQPGHNVCTWRFVMINSYSISPNYNAVNAVIKTVNKEIKAE